MASRKRGRSPSPPAPNKHMRSLSVDGVVLRSAAGLRFSIPQMYLDKYPESTFSTMVGDTRGDGEAVEIALQDRDEWVAPALVACYLVGPLNVPRPKHASAVAWNTTLRHYGLAPHDLPHDVPSADSLQELHRTRHRDAARQHTEWVKSVMGQCLRHACTAADVPTEGFVGEACIHLWLSFVPYQPIPKGQPWRLVSPPFVTNLKKTFNPNVGNIYEFNGTEKSFEPIHKMTLNASPDEMDDMFSDFVEHCRNTMGYRVSISLLRNVPERKAVLCTTIRWGREPAPSSVGRCIVS